MVEFRSSDMLDIHHFLVKLGGPVAEEEQEEAAS
jgi:hypothetical protein